MRPATSASASSATVGRRWPVLLGRLLAVGSVFPVALVVAVYTFVVRAHIELGRWPVPMQPDPKELAAADLHFALIGWLGLLTFACFLPWCLLGAIGWWKRLLPRGRVARAALVLPWLLFAAMITWDPGRFVEWILD